MGEFKFNFILHISLFSKNFYDYDFYKVKCFPKHLYTREKRWQVIRRMFRN